MFFSFPVDIISCMACCLHLISSVGHSVSEEKNAAALPAIAFWTTLRSSSVFFPDNNITVFWQNPYAMNNTEFSEICNFWRMYDLSPGKVKKFPKNMPITKLGFHTILQSAWQPPGAASQALALQKLGNYFWKHLSSYQAPVQHLSTVWYLVFKCIAPLEKKFPIINQANTKLASVKQVDKKYILWFLPVLQDNNSVNYLCCKGRNSASVQSSWDSFILQCLFKTVEGISIECWEGLHFNFHCVQGLSCIYRGCST